LRSLHCRYSMDLAMILSSWFEQLNRSTREAAPWFGNLGGWQRCDMLLTREDAMSFFHCEGWWEQAGYGR
jgi:hypothetical protein